MGMGLETENALAKFFNELPDMLRQFRMADSERAFNLELQKMQMQYSERLTNEARQIEANRSMYMDMKSEEDIARKEYESTLDKLQETGVGLNLLSDEFKTANANKINTDLSEYDATDYLGRADEYSSVASDLKARTDIMKSSLAGDIMNVQRIKQGAAGWKGGSDPTGWDADDIGIDAYTSVYGEPTPVAEAALAGYDPLQATKDLEVLASALDRKRNRARNDAKEFKLNNVNNLTALKGMFGAEDSTILSDVVENSNLSDADKELLRADMSQLNILSDPQEFVAHINKKGMEPVRDAYVQAAPYLIESLEANANMIADLESVLPTSRAQAAQNTLLDSTMIDFQGKINALPQNQEGKEKAFKMFTNLRSQMPDGQVEDMFFGAMETYFGEDLGSAYDDYIGDKTKGSSLLAEREAILQNYTTDGVVNDALIFNALKSLDAGQYYADDDLFGLMSGEGGTPLRQIAGLEEVSYGRRGNLEGDLIGIAENFGDDPKYWDKFHESLESSYQDVLAAENVDGWAPDWVHYGLTPSLELPGKFKREYPEHFDEALDAAKQAGTDAQIIELGNIIKNKDSRKTEYWKLIKNLEEIESNNQRNNVIEVSQNLQDTMDFDAANFLNQKLSKATTLSDSMDVVSSELDSLIKDMGGM